MTNCSVETIVEIINKSETIAIFGHSNPDGDCIGACCGLALSLELIGKKPIVILEEYSIRYDVIPCSDFVTHDFDNISADLCIALDCGDEFRFKRLIDLFKSTENINIDHHASNPYYGKYNYVFDDCSSTCEIVYGILKDNFPITKDVATALYTGIVYDTGGFRHSGVSADTFKCASELVSYKVPFSSIYDNLFSYTEFSEVKLMGRALNRSELIFDKQAIFSYVTYEEFLEFGATKQEVGGVVGALKNYQKIDLAVFLYEKKKNLFKVSMRSNSRVNVCEIAENFGGGGHTKASGCNITGTLDEVKEILFPYLEKYLATH